MICSEEMTARALSYGLFFSGDLMKKRFFLIIHHIFDKTEDYNCRSLTSLQLNRKHLLKPGVSRMMTVWTCLSIYYFSGVKYWVISF